MHTFFILFSRQSLFLSKVPPIAVQVGGTALMCSLGSSSFALQLGGRENVQDKFTHTFITKTLTDCVLGEGAQQTATSIRTLFSSSPRFSVPCVLVHMHHAQSDLPPCCGGESGTKNGEGRGKSMEPELKLLMLFMELLRKQQKYSRIWSARQKYRCVYIVALQLSVLKTQIGFLSRFFSLS